MSSRSLISIFFDKNNEEILPDPKAQLQSLEFLKRILLKEILGKAILVNIKELCGEFLDRFGRGS